MTGGTGSLTVTMKAQEAEDPPLVNAVQLTVVEEPSSNVVPDAGLHCTELMVKRFGGTAVTA